MKKIIISSLIICLIFIVGVIFKDINIKDSFAIFEQKKGRFITTGGYNIPGSAMVIIDRNTGVNYLWVENDYKRRINYYGR
jgi:hypothetical protein